MKNYKTLCKNSILEKEYLSHLQDDEIKVISFDIFDTLLFRKNSDLTDVFYKIGKKKEIKNYFGNPEIFRNFRIEAEKEARRRNKDLEEITIKDIYKQMKLDKILEEKIINYEYAEEFKSFYLNKQILEWIKFSKTYKKKLVFISDMYLDEKFIKKVLKYFLPKTLKYTLYLSSKHKLTKKDATLYEHVIKDLELKPKQILHIGDNMTSDIINAKRFDLRTLHYNISKILLDTLYIEKMYSSKLEYGNNYRIQAALLNPYKKKKDRFFYEFGAMFLAPILYEFLNWILKLEKDHATSQVNFLTREGITFERYLKKIDQNSNTNLIEASRRSTYLPSLELEKYKNEGIDFYSLKKIRVIDLYSLLNMKIKNKEIFSCKEEYFFDLEKSIKDLILIELKKEENEIINFINNQKEIFLKYLNNLDLNSKSILVDFGGTGTLLKRINDIKEDKEFINVLFYMNQMTYKNFLDKRFFSFFEYSDKTKNKIELLKRTPYIFELLLNGNNSTTTSYIEKNAKVKINKELPKYSKDFKKIMDATYKGLDSFFEVIKVYDPKIHFNREFLLDSLVRIIDIPSEEEALFLGQLTHDESLNSKKTYELICDQDIKKLHKNGILKSYYEFCKNNNYLLDDIYWVQGSITRIDKSLIRNIKSLNNKSQHILAIDNIINQLKFINARNIYIYGAGEFCKELLPHLSVNNIKVKGLIDTRAENFEFKFENYLVKGIFSQDIENNSIIVIASAVFTESIKEIINEYSHKQKKCIKIISLEEG